MKEYKIGIIGNGFVGSSVAFGFSPQTGCDAEVKIYDKDESKLIINERINSSELTKILQAAHGFNSTSILMVMGTYVTSYANQPVEEVDECNSSLRCLNVLV